MKISYNWLKSYIKDIPSKEELTHLITFKLCELEDVEDLTNGDTVFDMKILPDRAHDLLSHKGVAKEIAGMLGKDFYDSSHNSLESSLPTNLQIEVNSPLCKRYMGRIVRNVKVGPSPKWLVERLESIGQRSINNVVDITNFILFDLGQPIHAFDLDKLESEKIIVRSAKAGESISLLSFENGAKSRVVNLDENNLIIADEKEPVAIAGVKGGTKAEVDENTKNILIEVANFDSVSIRKTARKFGIQTDAVKRYENAITPNLCEYAMEEVSMLVNSICEDVKFDDVVDIYNEKPTERKASFTKEYISKVLGLDISNEDIENILKNYRYSFSRNENVFDFTIPDNRLDIEGAHDMAEEIGRVYGYDKIVPKLPEINGTSFDNNIWKNICLAKAKLISDGYKEVYTYVFTDKGEVEIMASASDKNFLRTNILDGLSRAYESNRLNAPFLGLNEIKIFEVGTVFGKNGEEIHVAYIDKKNKVEITLEEFEVPEVQPLIGFGGFTSQSQIFKPWSLYPFIYRDIAVWVSDGTDPDKLSDIYKEIGGNLLVKDPILLDKFIKDGNISYAYRLVFQSYEKTLKDEEVNDLMNIIGDRVRSFGFEVR